MSTPCNSLNVQLIKVSQLASYSSLKDTDKLMIVENTGGSSYSRNSLLSDLRNYILEEGVTGFPTGAYYTGTDIQPLSNYVSGTSTLTFLHGFGTVPSLVRLVLICTSPDGFYAINDEIDVTGCYNNNNLPLCTFKSKSSEIRVMVPAFSTANTYTYNGSSNVSVSLTTSRWNFKIYSWK